MPMLYQTCHYTLTGNQFCLYVILLTISNHPQLSRLNLSPTISRKPSEISPMLPSSVLPARTPIKQHCSMLLTCVCSSPPTSTSSLRKWPLSYLSQRWSSLIRSLKGDLEQLKTRLSFTHLRFKPTWFKYMRNSVLLLGYW